MSTFTIPNSINTYLPDYGDLSYELPVLSGVLFEERVITNDDLRIEALINALSDPAKAMFDSSLITLCGWSFSSLKSFSVERGETWIDVMIDETENDDSNPFKETGRFLCLWASCADEDRESIDLVYKALCGITLTAALEKIMAQIEKEL